MILLKIFPNEKINKNRQNILFDHLNEINLFYLFLYILEESKFLHGSA